MKHLWEISVLTSALVVPLTPAQDPAEVLGRPAAKVLLLGTFHFADPGLDDFKPQHDVDIRSPLRQREVEAVVDALARFRPTVVAVEQPLSRQKKLDVDYRRYREQGGELPVNEVYQLGFRVAARAGLERVHAVDARGRAYSPYPDSNAWAKAHDAAHLLESSWYAKYQQAAQYEDELVMRTTLGEFLRHLNDPARVIASHGVYLVGTFKAGSGSDYPGADEKTRWYNRNLRIFANLQRVTAREDERILCIVGAGHLPILRHCVQASPEYELVEAAEWLASPAGEVIDLDAVVREHTYELRHEDGRLSGPGMEFLLQEARAARFLGLAEPHNVREVPELVTMLMHALVKDAGYGYLALEQGPVVIQRIAEAARVDGFEDAVAVARLHRAALHFKTDQELRMIAEVARIPGAPVERVWGIDRILDPGPARAELAAADGERARFLRERIGAGQRHLQLHARARSEPLGYTANEAREGEMKELARLHVARAVAAGDAAPRVVFKTGHWHLRRGRNEGNVLTLGAMLAGWAEAEGSRAFLVNLQIVNRPGRYWSLTDHPDFAPIARAGSPDAWRVVDLRPLRDLVHARAVRVAPPLEHMIFGFDAVVLLGGASRGTEELLR